HEPAARRAATLGLHRAERGRDTRARRVACVHRRTALSARGLARLTRAGAARQQRTEAVEVVGGELARFDLEAIVPIAFPQPLSDVAGGGQQARLPLLQHMAVLVKHQRGVLEELVGASDEVDAPLASRGGGTDVRLGEPGVLDDAYVLHAVAEERLESSQNL